MTKCCYCGRDIALNLQTRHRQVCIQGPTGNVLREFLRKHAYRNLVMTRQEYTESTERKALMLPSVTTIVRHFGEWKHIATWCGLDYVPHVKKAKNDMTNMGTRGRDFYAAALESVYDFRAMPVARQYTERYRDLDTGEVHDRYVMVLR